MILVPTALGVGDADHVTPFCSVPARAAENAVFVLYSNLSGKNHRVSGGGRRTEGCSMSGSLSSVM